MENNPPAFPLAISQFAHERGMTLRDYFAGQFALVAGATGLGKENTLDKEGTGKIAVAAYRLADAMLAARKVTPDA